MGAKLDPRDAKEFTRERTSLLWAGQLRGLGQRESGTAKLEEAVAAYREALKEWTRERMPLDWAGVQNNLGMALRGSREARERNGKAGRGRRCLPRGADGMDP